MGGSPAIDRRQPRMITPFVRFVNTFNFFWIFIWIFTKIYIFRQSCQAWFYVPNYTQRSLQFANLLLIFFAIRCVQWDTKVTIFTKWQKFNRLLWLLCSCRFVGLRQEDTFTMEETCAHLVERFSEGNVPIFFANSAIHTEN